MRLLLDTHALLWWIGDEDRLNKASFAMIASRDNEILVSAASLWEISTKRNLGKLQAPENMCRVVQEKGFTGLPISLIHAETAGALPLLHRDPFDRMLVAQAKIEGLTLMSDDPRIAQYDVKRIGAGK